MFSSKQICSKRRETSSFCIGIMHCLESNTIQSVFRFQVSKVVWKLLLAKHMELRHIKAYKYHPFAKRNSGRYRPYSNVDSFLKVYYLIIHIFSF